jgi:hypothetical protein
MKRLLTAILCVLCLTSLISCAESGKEPDNSSKPAWKNDVEIDTLAAELDKCLDIDLKYMEDVDEDWYSYVLCADLSLYESGLVRTSAKDSDISEYGIFKAGANNDTAEISDMIESYIKIKQDNWDDRYLQDQHSKLKNASVFTCGSYVFYTVLSDSEKAEFEQTAASLLKISYE